MKEIKTEVAVLGSGPGGYTAAFRAADLGKKVVLIERHGCLGGVCLNVGCIPSKAYLHAARVIEEAQEMKDKGIDFGSPNIDVDKIRGWKEGIVKQLTGGLKLLAKRRKIEIIHGFGKFISSNQIEVECEDEGEKTVVTFENAIVAVGSRPRQLSLFPEDPRIITSTGALNIQNPKCRMLIVGAGIIGLEMATVYHALGAEITIVELQERILMEVGADTAKPLQRRIQKQYQNLYFKTGVEKVEAKAEAIHVTFSDKAEPALFDLVLCVIGRQPNGDLVEAKNAGLSVDERGFISVDKQQRTNVPHIFAIGDVVGNPMLAHKASHEGRIAAEVIAGLKHFNDAKCIPSIAYTDPEIAWVGITELQAQKQGLDFGKGVFPWVASGRALSVGRTEGQTKVIFDQATKKVIGAEIVGVNAGELIAEMALAIEMGCDAEDIALTIHPHPTLSESLMMATEVFEGTVTDM